MANFSPVIVKNITSQRRGLQCIEVERVSATEPPDEPVAHKPATENAYVLTDLTGPAQVGDQVVVNTTAVDLSLGTGGWHFVSANLSHPQWESPSKGHIMKLRYTPMQIDAGACEETSSPTTPHSLNSTPVVVCLLHSQIAPVVLAAKHVNPHIKVAYLMTDSASLAYPLSNLANELEERGFIDFSFTAGQAFGARNEAVNVASGALCASEMGADLLVVAPGPGVVGTGSKFGFGSLEMAGQIQLLNGIGASTILAARYSSADTRSRHRGLSHHSQTVLEMCATPTTVAIPESIESHEFSNVPSRHKVVSLNTPAAAQLLSGHNLSVTTMGRTPLEDVGFFEVAAAAGVLGAQTSEGPPGDQQ